MINTHLSSKVSRRKVLKYSGLATLAFLSRRAFGFGSGGIGSSGDLELVLNPYQGINWSSVDHHKANFHTHTNGHKLMPDGTVIYANGVIIGPDGQQKRGRVSGHNHEWRDPHPDFVNAEGRQMGSDGSLLVDEVIDAYHGLGYTILALTDHDRVTWPWESFGRDPKDLGMLAVVGNEPTRSIHHFLSLFTDYEPDFSGRVGGSAPLAERNAQLDGLLAGVAESGGLSVMAHPSADRFGWPGHFTENQVGSLDVPLEPDLRAITNGDFTVETWFRTDDAGRGVLFGNYESPGKVALNLELQSRNQVRVFLHTPDAAPNVNLVVDANTIGVNTRDGRWHHLAATREGASVRLYLNGREVARSDAGTGKMPLAGEFMHLGRDVRTGNTMFNGSLDQVRFWQRALAANELSAIQQGTAPASVGLLRHFAFNPAGRIPASGDFPSEAMLVDASGNGVAAIPSASGAPIVDRSVAPVLREAGISSASLRFGAPELPSPANGVPGYVLQRYLDIYNENPTCIGIEVLNGTRPRDYPYCRALWDDILTELMPGRPVWGFANDDLHGMGHLGRDWNVVLTESLDESSVRNALERGAFFFASIRPAGSEAALELTPEIRAIRHDQRNGTLSAEATVNGQPSARDAYAWIANGETVAVGPVVNYRSLPSDTRYVRLEVTGKGGVIHSNPFGLAAK